jgi:hypothetical protein
MLSLQHKKEVILEAEEAFTRSIARTLFERPTVSFWMILIPFLFLYFIYRMKKYQTGHRRFQEEFMLTRRKALDLAMASATFGTPPRIDDWMQRVGLAPELSEPYRQWLAALVQFHQALLAAEGDDFAELVRSAFPGRAAFIEAMQRLAAAEKAFHDALQPGMQATPGAPEIVAAIEERARSLRLEIANTIYSTDTSQTIDK